MTEHPTAGAVGYLRAVVREGVPPPARRAPGSGWSSHGDPRDLEEGGPALAAEDPLVVGPRRTRRHVPVVLASDNLK